jgi:hypothetical protein
MQYTHEALDRDTGGGEQKQGQGDLTGDEDRVEPLSAHASGNFSRTGLHDLADFGTGKLKSGKESKEYSSDHGKADTEQQHGHVYVEISLVWE